MTEFESQTIERLARIEANQVAHKKMADIENKSQNVKITNLEHTVNGNGKKGLAEEVRGVKTRLGWTIVIATFVINVGIQVFLRLT